MFKKNGSKETHNELMTQKNLRKNKIDVKNRFGGLEKEPEEMWKETKVIIVEEERRETKKEGR